MAPSARKALSLEDDAKLIFGTVFSLRRMARQLGGQDDQFLSFRTGEYKMHYFETPTQLKFVMLTDTRVGNMRTVLHQIWATLYVEYVVKSPIVPIEHPKGTGVANELFDLGLETFIVRGTCDSLYDCADSKPELLVLCADMSCARSRVRRRDQQMLRALVLRRCRRPRKKIDAHYMPLSAPPQRSPSVSFRTFGNHSREKHRQSICSTTGERPATLTGPAESERDRPTTELEA